MLKIWGRANAYNVQKVLWFIDELALDFEHIDIGSQIGELERDSFRAMNPHGRIPIIRDDADYIWESNSILRYLAAAYGKAHYWSESPLERSFVERWMDWELATLQPNFLALFWGFFRTPEPQRDQRKIAHSIARCEKNLALLDKHLEQNSYLSGEFFTLSDVTIGTSFYRYFNMGIEAPTFSHINRWYQQLANRPAYQRNIMVSFDELKGRLTF